MSLREYATHRGVTLRAVQKALETGRIQKSKDGKIDAASADVSWNESTDPSKQRGDTSSTSEAFAKARAAREAYNAKLAQLNYEQRSGNLVDSSAVRRRAFENARAVRDVLLNIPNRISGELAGETDPAKVHTMLTVEITRALEELTSARSSVGPASEHSALAVSQTDAESE